MPITSCEKIYQVVKQIPSGKVMTYKLVALKSGVLSPRYVGFCLHHNPDHNNIPCHRVVNSNGRVAQTFAFGGNLVQENLLKNEGIKMKNGKVVDLDKFIFKD